ncbi:MD-2-related lipid-recognition domain [Dillenia turbinata]|uniref:MD-2-related lipid-recognition domain n=1 Tax=Dillenia turbinata TaxID=194707 RepID=A0AAN8VFF4_9MAGN
MAQFQTTFLFLVICLIVPLIQAKEAKYCDRKANYAVKITGIDIIPDPVVSGKPATFKISASTAEALAGGTVVLDVSYFGVHVHSETHDLCEETSCPISTGDFVLSHTQTLPGFTPPGSYSLKMRLEDAGGSQLTCISFNFNIGFGSLVFDN